MNTKPLTLTEASKRIDELGAEKAMQDKLLQDFVMRVETAGKQIVLNHGAEEYVEEASIFIFSGVLEELLNDSDSSSMLTALAISQNPDTFKILFGYAFVYSVGLAAVEELH